MTGILSFPLLQKENYYRQNKYAALDFHPVTAIDKLKGVSFISYMLYVFCVPRYMMTLRWPYVFEDSLWTSLSGKECFK